MESIKVFRHEHKDKLGDLIQSKGSLQLFSSLMPSLNMAMPRIEVVKSKAPSTILATLDDIVDLYPMETILVTSDSTKTNLNDVLFPKADTFAARLTPIDKPFNFNHNELDIIGHITASVAVDDDYNEIAEEKDLIDKFHIKTSAVMYKHWRNEERQEQIDKIIAEIPDNKWFVSMECLFYHFDYAVQASDGVFSIVARNDETSYLTKYLRHFNGTGSYNGYKIGMAPRNFIFSGKGLTENPANPESEIIQSTSSTSVLITASINDGDKKMDQTELVDGLKAELATAKSELKAANDKIANDNVAKLQATLDKSEASVAKLTASVDELTKEVADKTEKLAVAEKTVADLAAEKSKLEASLATVQAEKLSADRVSSLVSAGVDKADAESLVAEFAGLSDAQFEKVSSLKIEAVKASKPASEVAGDNPFAKDKKKDKEEKDKEMEVDCNTTATLSASTESNTVDVIMQATAFLNTREVLSK